MKRLLCVLLLLSLTACASPTTTTGYETRALHDPDGIGKFYMGREIAQVMGFSGAAWLERPSREETEQPTAVIQALKLKPTDVVADIGAGTGYFSFRISPLVKKILAVDVQPEMIRVLKGLSQDRKITNVQPILGTEQNPNLPAGVDLVLMVDTYHEFTYPQEMMTAIVQALKPGGRVVLVEYRGEDPTIPIKAVHKITEAQARREMNAVGLTWQSTLDFLPKQHVLIFTKP